MLPSRICHRLPQTQAALTLTRMPEAAEAAASHLLSAGAEHEHAMSLLLVHPDHPDHGRGKRHAACNDGLQHVAVHKKKRPGYGCARVRPVAHRHHMDGPLLAAPQTATDPPGASLMLFHVDSLG